MIYDRHKSRVGLVERLAEATGRPLEWVEATLGYDWPNRAEHEAWLEAASEAEIASWLLSLSADAPAVGEA